MVIELVHAIKQDGTALIKFDMTAMAHVLEAYAKIIQSYANISNPDDTDVKKLETFKEEKQSVQYCRDAAAPQ